MTRRGLVAGVLTLVCAISTASATPMASFDDATRLDLEGKPQLAFAAYLAAALAGLPQAEFNVAVMLDSGRGVAPDMAQAATWYARAAAHGNARAAYNLGQLFESGEGVPRNADLARAWFETANLPAAQGHMLPAKGKVSNAELQVTAPDPIAPVDGIEIASKSDEVELIWTSTQQAGPALYYIELLCADGTGSIETYAKTVTTSSTLVGIEPTSEVCAWRVTTLVKSLRKFAASQWSEFQRP